MSEMILKDHGVCRVHGGGFVERFRPLLKIAGVETYKEEIEKVFGKEVASILKVRKLVLQGYWLMNILVTGGTWIYCSHICKNC